MAKEIKVEQAIEKAGYEPITGRSIIVSYAATNLSDKVAKFFSNEFYVFQMCKNEMVLVPFGKWTWSLKKDVVLEIPYDSINSISVTESGLNYNICIKTKTDEITLSAQQKELSDFRSAGILATDVTGSTNWHKDNLDATLEALKNLKK